MSASAAARARVGAVEKSIEARIALDGADVQDRREDEARTRAKRYVRGLLVAMRDEDRFDELGDVERHRAHELVTELCGILDGVQQPPLFPVVDVSRTRERAS